MGRVYLANDPVLAREVALKVPRYYPSESLPTNRLFQEARVAGQLHHSQICPVYDAGTVEQIPYLTMRYIRGQTLAEAYPPPVPAAQAVELVLQLADPLQYAHAHGIIHRDLKPSNVMVEADTGRLLVSDFGLARSLRGDDAYRLTVEGMILGSPAYMAPEQTRDAAAVGPSADVYALGVILFELLTAHWPYSGSAGEVILQKYRNLPPARPRQFVPDLDEALQAICLRAIANELADRYASMEELAEALRQWQRGWPAASVPKAESPALGDDPRLVERVLAKLREWGWEEGLRQLREEVLRTPEPERPSLELLLGWLDAEQGRYELARKHLQQAAAQPPLRGWALLVQALIALREHDYAQTADLLNQAEALAQHDSGLSASVAHTRGAMLCHQGRLDAAAPQLHRALRLFGRQHYFTGRVLDSLGMLHHYRGRFALAEDYFDRALRAKQTVHDELGIALTQAQLGRLYLDDGQLQAADENFLAALVIARRTNDERAECQLTNHRARVRIASGQPDEALVLLEDSLRLAQGRYPILSGFGYKDRAHAHLLRGDHAAAEADLVQARSLFTKFNFASGLAHLQQVRGWLSHRLGRFDQAERELEMAANQLQRQGLIGEAARCWLELGRVRQQLASGGPCVGQALGCALELAIRGGLGHLADAVHAEFRRADPVGLLDWHIRQASGGLNHRLERGRWHQQATVIAVELRRFSQVSHPSGGGGSRGSDGGDGGGVEDERKLLLVELVAELSPCADVLVQRSGAKLLVLVHGDDHARRANDLARRLDELARLFNDPRQVLGLPTWQVGVGVSTGLVRVERITHLPPTHLAILGQPVDQAQELASCSLNAAAATLSYPAQQ